MAAYNFKGIEPSGKTWMVCQRDASTLKEARKIAKELLEECDNWVAVQIFEFTERVVEVIEEKEK